MANVIKIKRSTTTATPSALSEGELAYSESSDNLFVGISGGNVAKIGGNADVVKLSNIEDNANNYSLPSSVVHSTEAQALASDALSIVGHTITLTKGDSTTESVTVPDNNTTYSVGDGGLTEKNFTTTLKNKLDGVASSANNYSLPTASSSVLGGVKTGTGITNTSGTISVSTAYLADSHPASGVTSTKITAWDNAAAWYSTMTTADADNIINTVNEVVSAFQNHSEGLNLITELDSKLSDSSTIDGGTF